MVRAATNVARAFAQVHAVGHVIGDVNHGNALVGRDGTVVLIDCDSLEKLGSAREELNAWASVRKRKLRAMRREAASRARELFLERLRIDRANLSLRREDIAALASFGIESAADVMRESRKLMHAIPAQAAQDLRDWATGHGHRFVFDKHAPPDPELTAQLESRLAERQHELLTLLRNGPAELELTRQQIESARERMEPKMKDAWKELQEAREALRE